jgi:hypothetical protein
MSEGMIHGDGKVIEKIGHYYIQETDYLYQALSGYKYVVNWSRVFCHRQIKGFREDQLSRAKIFLKKTAAEGLLDKNYEKSKKKDMKDPKNWKATCSECGDTMDFTESTFTYHCSKCGNRLEV